MALPIRNYLWVLCLLCAFGRGMAQPGGTPAPAQTTGPRLPGAHAASDTKPKAPVPALPGTKTAADTFRELLAMSSAERADALADRSEHQRQYLQGRLREYESLSPGEREARLQQLELTCQLDILLRMPPARRLERLSLVPATLRPIIEDRLRQWDALPAQMKQEVLEHETTANYFLRVRAAPTTPGLQNSLRSSPPGAPEKQRKRLEPFTHFLRLSEKEQQKTLEALPAAERDEMERALNAFAKLPSEQRRICIESFERFSRMSPEQRNEFLESAERWKAMSPRERETWRALINILPPTPPVSTPPPLPTGGIPRDGAVTASNTSALPAQ